MAKPTGRPVRDELIEAATDLIQSVGVKAFSYGDLAKQLDIKAPSIHHHFRTKEDLVAAVAELYRSTFSQHVEQIQADSSLDRIQQYADLFTRTASSNRLCLCGAVAAEWLSVGAASQAQVEGFFAEQVDWLTSQLTEGITTGELRSDLNANDMARSLFAALEGSMLMSRSGDPADLASQIGGIFLALAKAPY